MTRLFGREPRESRKPREGVPLARADLHVHSTHSLDTARWGSWEFPFRPTSTPLAIYQRARGAGMDFVTLTDHDTIDGCIELLSSHPEVESRFIIGEEITTFLPRSGAEIHISVFGIDEGQHREIQKRRRNLVDLAEYLRSTGLVFTLNHPVWDSRGRVWSRSRLRELFLVLRNLFRGIEARNGSSFGYQNDVARLLAREYGLFTIGGSDTHSDQVGYTYTVARARTKDEFLAAIACGKSRVRGGQLTPRFFRREVRKILQHNFARQRVRLAEWSGRFFGALVDRLGGCLVREVAKAYLRVQRTALRSGLPEFGGGS